jgi:PAS domain S-box-containing protein
MISETNTFAYDEAQHAAELLELGDAFVEFDRDWRIVRVNRRLEKISQKPRSEALGRTFAEVWPELATPRSIFWRECHRCMTERAPVQFEAYSAPRALWVGVTAYPIRTGGIAVFLRDITAIKQEAREKAHLAAIIENTNDAIISKNLEGIVVTWNIGAERLFGYAAHEVIGRPIALLLPQDRLDEEDRILAELRAGHSINHFETRRVRKDGSLVEVSVTISPIRGDTGEIIGASKIARDITERTRAERALKASEEKFRSVFESAAVGVARVSIDGRFIEVNQAYADIVGYSRGELMTLDFRAITHPDDLASAVDQFTAVVEGRIRSRQFEKRYFRKDGSIVWVSRSIGLVRDDEGRPYITGVVEDITERKRAVEALRVSEEKFRGANARLREADRRKDEFLGMLSHELRNPLAPIRNSLYILDHTDPAGEQARRAKEVASRQVAHLTRLVDDLLDVTRVARGKIELRRVDLDLAALVRRTADDYQALMKDRGLGLVVEVPTQPLVVNGDETRLAQVFGNLLSNAAKFTPAGGCATMTANAEDGHAVVRVRDTGPGIAPDLLHSIFEPFIQGKQTLARSEGGLGLGLALVRGLVALHSGNVGVSSPGSGYGTEFVVSLPLCASRDERTSAQASRLQRRSLATVECS